MSRKYKFHDQNGIYFVSFATVYWIDVFTRQSYFDVIIDALKFCQQNKGMKLYGYCIMPSHIHLLFKAEYGNPSELLQNFKSFTAKEIIKQIKQNIQESRQDWLLWMFKRAGNKNSNVQEFQFWQQHNQPIEIFTERVFSQKLEYIHQNPVESGFVMNAWEWKYSSARNYNELEAVLEIEILN